MLRGSFAIPSPKVDGPKRDRSFSRPWVVVVDPSGDFLGRAFRSFDIDGAPVNIWPQGIVFCVKR